MRRETCPRISIISGIHVIIGMVMVIIIVTAFAP